MAKRPPDDRRRKIAEARKAEKRAERRRTMLTIGLASLLGLGLIAGVVLTQQKEDSREIHELGVNEPEAGCGEVVEKKSTGAQHVDDQPIIEYADAPPTSGDHRSQPKGLRPRFYDRDDDDAVVEQLVHNLEHGYVVIWYDAELPDEQVDELREIVNKTESKVLVAPWNRGSFPEDKNVVLTAWEHSRACTAVSGDVVETFVDEYRAPGGAKATAPEPNGA